MVGLDCGHSASCEVVHSAHGFKNSEPFLLGDAPSFCRISKRTGQERHQLMRLVVDWFAFLCLGRLHQDARPMKNRGVSDETSSASFLVQQELSGSG